MVKKHKDLKSKLYFSQNKYFAEIINFIAGDGKHELRHDDLHELDPNMNLIIDDEVIQRERDVYKIAKILLDEQTDEQTFCIFGFELQSQSRLDMPIRCLTYDAIGYYKQTRDIKNKNTAENAKDVEFLSGLKETDKIMGIVPIVINLGHHPWAAPTKSQEMMYKLPKRYEWMPRKNGFILFDPHTLSEEDLDVFQTDIKALLGCIKHQNDDDLSFLTHPRYNHVEMDTLDLIKTFTNIEIEVNEPTKEGEGFNMCRAYEREIAKRRAEGRAEILDTLSNLKGFISTLVKKGIDFDLSRLVSDEEYRNDLIKMVNA